MKREVRKSEINTWGLARMNHTPPLCAVFGSGDEGEPGLSFSEAQEIVWPCFHANYGIESNEDRSMPSSDPVLDTLDLC
jgi:hypothetical protein